MTWPSPSGNGGRAPRTRCTACASTNFASGCACCSSAISIRTGRSSCWLIWAFIATSRCPFPRLTSVQFACRAGRLPASASLSRALRCRRAAGGDTGGCTGRAVRQCLAGKPPRQTAAAHRSAVRTARPARRRLARARVQRLSGARERAIRVLGAAASQRRRWICCFRPGPRRKRT